MVHDIVWFCMLMNQCVSFTHITTVSCLTFVDSSVLGVNNGIPSSGLARSAPGPSQPTGVGVARRTAGE